MMHETIESLSAYLDRELPAFEHARIEAHVAACSACAAQKAALEGVVSAVCSLPAAAPTADESRALRQQILRRMGRRGRMRWWPTPRAWAGAGALGLVLLGAVAGYSLLRPQPGQQAVTPPVTADSLAQAPLELASAEDVRSAVSSQPEVLAGVQRYRVADVAGNESRTFVVPKSIGGDTAELVAPAPREAAGSAAPEQSAQSCMTQVLEAQTNPSAPLLARAARYRGRPAWLLVYAWTDSAEREARLDRILVYLVSRADCSTLHHQLLDRP